MFLAAPNQPGPIMDRLEEYFGDDLVISGDIPVDFQFWGHLGSDNFRVMLERKKCPEDLYASWRDGRLRRQCFEMATNPGPNYLILEGDITYNSNLRLRNGRYNTELTFEMLTGLFLTCTTAGVWPLPTPNEEATTRLLITTYNYFQKAEHHSLISRQGLKSPWGRPSKSDLVLHLFQGFPGIGVKTAQWAWATTGTFRNFASLSEEAIKAIPGFGPKTSKAVTDLLDMKCPPRIYKKLR